MTFGHPYVLLLLLLLPLLSWLKGKQGKPPAFVYSSVQLVRGILNVTRTRSGAFLAALRWLALALLIIALAQPRLTKSETRVTASGVDIVVALDMSGSMASEDFEVGRERLSRLAMAKEVLKKFIEKRPNDRIGIVAFATQAYIACPLTLDHEFLLQNLARLDLGTIDNNRTAIGSALSTAINRLRELKSKSKIVILMTDGQNNAGKRSPVEAARLAKEWGIKVYAIGIGGRESFVTIHTPLGDYKVPGGPGADEPTLKAIADETGGAFWLAESAAKLHDVYQEIDKLERTEIESVRHIDYAERFVPFVLAGLALLFLEQVLVSTVLRRIP
ncbi:MAG TPA: hypothetical protein DCZ69_19125 [Syntrophobacteraceae bacterium]|nr:hypothetical protein [Syntrophobacteraceae bacterium]